MTSGRSVASHEQSWSQGFQIHSSTLPPLLLLFTVPGTATSTQPAHHWAAAPHHFLASRVKASLLIL